MMNKLITGLLVLFLLSMSVACAKETVPSPTPAPAPVTGTGTPQTAPDSSDTGNVTTTQGVEGTADIGFRFPSGVRVRSTSFLPNISETSAIAVARDLLKTAHGVKNADEMADKATVAFFEGPRHDLPRTRASNMQVWIVVVDTPFDAGGGPPPPTTARDMRPKPIPLQYNVVVDAETGKVIYSVLSGKP